MDNLMSKATAPLDSRCDHCGVAGRAEPNSVRCGCGSLLARYVPGGVELKCRRCKRVVVVPVPAAAEDVSD
jgi:phage FluMu protein Com